MPYLRIFGLLATVGICLLSPSNANAQPVFVGVGVGPAYYGPAPVCVYGYYGPEWFVSGVFIGAGPWFYGFYGRPFYRGGF